MFYLQTWMNRIVGQVLCRDCVSASDYDAYRLLRLRQTIQYAYAKSSFYRQELDAAGISPGEIIELSDLSMLPLTEPRNLAESPYRFLCVSQGSVERPHSFVTSGTTGPQKKVFWTPGDLERIIEFMAAGIATIAGPDDVIQILLADGRPYSQADLLYRGVKSMGATPVIAGMDATADEQLRIIEEAGTTILFGYTGQIFRLSKELERKTALGAKGIKALFLAGEYLPDSMRRQLGDAWGCDVYTHYGMTEMGLGVAVECEAHDGFHFNEAGLLLEIVDPQTGEPVPRGEEGEIVFTTLIREGMPLLRYRTHDISRIIPEPCPCGAANLLRIAPVRKRLESIVSINEELEIYPALLDDILYEIPGLVDYQAKLLKEDGRVRLDFYIEMASKENFDSQAIRRKLTAHPLFAALIAAGQMSEPSLTMFEMERKRVIGRPKKLISVDIG